MSSLVSLILFGALALIVALRGGRVLVWQKSVARNLQKRERFETSPFRFKEVMDLKSYRI